MMLVMVTPSKAERVPALGALSMRCAANAADARSGMITVDRTVIVLA